jgi:DNA-binding response OmpR family regulator
VTRVLLVEDDADIAEPLARALARDGYDVTDVGDGRVTLQAVLDAPPDLIILDIGLPGMNGLDVCRHVREVRPQVPILMLTARDGELETVAGLDAGADDYVTKPFRLAEPLARARALLRRSAPPELVAGDVRVDEASRQAWRGERLLDLSPKEFDLLVLLVREAGKVVTRERIMDDVWERQLVRLYQDARHAHVLAAQEARRTTADHDRPPRRLPLRALNAPAADRHQGVDRPRGCPRPRHPTRHRRECPCARRRARTPGA